MLHFDLISFIDYNPKYFNLLNKKPNKIVRCSSYCTASDYKISDLVEYLNNNGLEPKHFDDVIYAQKENR